MTNSIPEWITDFEKVKDRLFIACVPADFPDLEHLAHGKTGDMAVTYNILISETDESMVSVPVTKILRDLYGITSAELHELAVENSMKIMPVEIYAYNGNGELEPEAEGDISMYRRTRILTNKAHTMGASAVLYPGVLDAIAEDFGGCDFLVAPTSVDECIAVANDGAVNIPAVIMSASEMYDNICRTDPELRLSPSLYYYSQKNKTFGQMIPKADDLLS